MGAGCLTSSTRLVTIDEAMAAKPKTSGLHPGERAPASGQYHVVGPRGGKTGREVTATKGKPMPPSQEHGQTYKLVDRTKHKR